MTRADRASVNFSVLTALIAFAVLASPPKAISILFIGNSHTAAHDVPAMVERLLEEDGSREVSVDKQIGAILNSLAKQGHAADRIKGARWDFVVLQGASMSSSHKYTYPNDGGVSLAKLARQNGAKTLLFAEWPRRGWDESGYIMGIYRQIAKASGAEVVPVPYAFDATLKKHPKLQLWAADGNHSSEAGAYLAACTLYFRIAGSSAKNPTWRPKGLAAGTAADFHAASKKAARA